MADQMITTEVLRAGLYAHYGREIDVAKHGGVATESDLLVEEVAAPGTDRRIDVLRIGMWQSRGHRIVAHELKVSRSDWLRELKSPAKAEAWWPHCHQFYVVAPSGVVDPVELPPGWGLLVPPASGARTRRFREAVKPATKAPEVTPELMIEVVRRVDNRRLAQISALNRQHDNDRYQAVLEEKRRSLVDPGTVSRLELLDKVEGALNAKLAEYGWRGAAHELTTGEVGEAMAAYVTEHVRLNRWAEELEARAQSLARAARYALDATVAPSERAAQ